MSLTDSLVNYCYLITQPVVTLADIENIIKQDTNIINTYIKVNFQEYLPIEYVFYFAPKKLIYDLVKLFIKYDVNFNLIKSKSVSILCHRVKIDLILKIIDITVDKKFYLNIIDMTRTNINIFSKLIIDVGQHVFTISPKSKYDKVSNSDQFKFIINNNNYYVVTNLSLFKYFMDVYAAPDIVQIFTNLYINNNTPQSLSESYPTNIFNDLISTPNQHSSIMLDILFKFYVKVPDVDKIIQNYNSGDNVENLKLVLKNSELLPSNIIVKILQNTIDDEKLYMLLDLKFYPLKQDVTKITKQHLAKLILKYIECDQLIEDNVLLKGALLYHPASTLVSAAKENFESLANNNKIRTIGW